VTPVLFAWLREREMTRAQKTLPIQSRWDYPEMTGCGSKRAASI